MRLDIASSAVSSHNERVTAGTLKDDLASLPRPGTHTQVLQPLQQLPEFEYLTPPGRHKQHPYTSR